MYITDLSFIFWFLPLSLILYHFVPDRIKEYVLLAVSLFFYACGSRTYFFLFLISITVNVILGRCLYKREKPDVLRTLMLVCGIVLDVSLLGYYKYSHFHSFLLPLGISFFTFKEISYLVDAYTGKAVLEENPLHDALYLSFFAQLQSGPISRYADMGSSYKDASQRRKRKLEMFSEGCYRFIIGFNKKILLADVLSNITAQAFSASPGQMSAALAWLGAVCYSLQLFFDFSGYSDMAIGISGMFGYKCPENFKYPYMTASVSEFWRRWHITLGAWFRDYIYIPLGGSRIGSKGRVYFNLFVVWILTGIWHGASWNFVFWGVGYFVLIVFEKLTGLPKNLKTRFGKIVYRILTLLFINFQWVMFRSGSLNAGLCYIKNMLLCPPNELADATALFLLRDNLVFILCAVVFCFPVVPWLEKVFVKEKRDRVLWEIAVAVIPAVLFVWALSFVVSGQNNPFAYANF
ncbi:MAG: MBOAT family protein [Lachnospiraceae bacterium]|nr:MBOAT family protein [Lachnospiraceae bacterium]